MQIEGLLKKIPEVSVSVSALPDASVLNLLRLLRRSCGAIVAPHGLPHQYGLQFGGGELLENPARDGMSGLASRTRRREKGDDTHLSLDALNSSRTASVVVADIAFTPLTGFVLEYGACVQMLRFVVEWAAFAQS
jgi:hypothetical protein